MGRAAKTKICRRNNLQVKQNVPAQGNRGRRASNSAPRSTARGGGFHGHGGTPNSWIIYLLENPIQVDKREREREIETDIYIYIQSEPTQR